MRSVLFRIPLPGGHGIPIYAYGFMVMVGFLAAIFVARRRAVKLGIRDEAVLDMGLIAVCAGILGARVFHIIEFRHEYFAPGENPLLRMLAINRGGLVWYGGLIFATLGILIYIQRKKLAMWRVADLLAPSAMLGLAFGRIGCFLNGCCYGKPCHLPWAVTFPRTSHPYEGGGGMPIAPGTPLHPTQIYMSLTAFLLFLILSYAFYHRRREGQVMALLGLLYPVGRFINEMFRADTYAPNGLTTSQKLSIFIFIVAACFTVWVWRHGARVGPTATTAPVPPAAGKDETPTATERRRQRRRQA